MGVFSDIESALGVKLKTVVNRPLDANIAWENGAEYTPVIGTRWWRPTNLPAQSIISTASAVQKHQGFYQVDVFVPTNKGTKDLLADLDNIYTAFNTTLSLEHGESRIDILSVGRGRIVREQSWVHGFIKIDYMCYSA